MARLVKKIRILLTAWPLDEPQNLWKNLQAKAGLSSLTAKFGIRSLTSTGRAKKSILGTSFRFYPSPPAGKKRKVGTRILLAQFKGIQMKNSLINLMCRRYGA